MTLWTDQQRETHRRRRARREELLNRAWACFIWRPAMQSYERVHYSAWREYRIGARVFIEVFGDKAIDRKCCKRERR